MAKNHKAHEKMLTTKYQINANQNYKEVVLTILTSYWPSTKMAIAQMAVNKKYIHNKC